MLIDPELVSDFEIVIGLVAPIGTDLLAVSKRLSDDLRVFGYDSEVVRLSQLFDKRESKESFGYYEDRMNACDEFREKIDSGDAVAALGISHMVKVRSTKGEARTKRKAWIFRTLKHDHEVKLLRQVFGSRFVLVGVHQSPERRKRKLGTLALDDGMAKKDVPGAVSNLIERDEIDEDNPLGQRVRETFRLADYFMDLDKDLPSESSRLVGLLFGEPFITPNRDEGAMYAAFAASLRSADPGRQVGAVVANELGDILATGANDVPRAGGGEYWNGDKDDARDFVRGYDFNKRQSQRILAETLDTLASEGHLASDLTKLSSHDRTKAVWKKSESRLKGDRMMSLVEFGRIVHAEMSALMQAARSSTSVRGATLYTTAFPCHMCMRLIVAAGISRVIYVDPYPKSMAPEMYDDSVSESARSTPHVLIQAYRGAGWGVYVSLFAAINRGRYDDGTFLPFEKEKARYRLAEPDPLLNSADLEGLTALELGRRIELAGVGGKI